MRKQRLKPSSLPLSFKKITFIGFLCVCVHMLACVHACVCVRECECVRALMHTHHVPQHKCGIRGQLAVLPDCYVGLEG